MGGVIPWVHARESDPCTVLGSLHTLCPVGGVIPWVQARESAGVHRNVNTINLTKLCDVHVNLQHTIPSGLHKNITVQATQAQGKPSKATH